MVFRLTPKLNLQLYGLLMVITPFLLLQNYLQDAMGMLSRLTFSIGEQEFPVILFVALLLVLVALFYLITNFTLNRLYGLILVFFLFLVGYNTSDYYYNHHFYDIQHNWHYFAYAIYTWLAWRHFLSKKYPPEKIILRTFLLALGISAADELIQVFISSRVFDLSDVAKDLWGCMIGQVFIHFVIFNAKFLSKTNFWRKGIKDWTKHGLYLLTLEIIFAWVFLNVSSIISDAQYAGNVLFITLLIFIFLSFLLHYAGKKPARYFVMVFVAFLIIYPLTRLTLSEPKVSVTSGNIIIYKGLPVPYFDLMIYPNGMIRPVDKKTAFNIRDKQKIEAIGADIVIFGTGKKGQGGKGYQDQLKVELKYNFEKDKVYQIIKLPNKEACKLYNKLVKEGKQILMIIHNS